LLLIRKAIAKILLNKIMQIHEIQPKNKSKNRKRVGRGGKRGTYSGRGMKGQKSRAGTRKKEPEIRRLIKRYPKLRGYKFSPLGSVFVVNLSILNKLFDENSEVSPKSLIEKGLISKNTKKSVKILGEGKIEKSIKVKECLFSKTAKEKIEKAGGSVEDKKKKDDRKNS